MSESLWVRCYNLFSLVFPNQVYKCLSIALHDVVYLLVTQMWPQTTNLMKNDHEIDDLLVTKCGLKLQN